MIITIDGAVATGKSTVAKKVAQSLGFIYFDTGAMYRALSYAIVKNKVDFHDPHKLQKFIDTFTCKIKIFHGEKSYIVDGEDVTDKIRTPEISEVVSEISAIPIVRKQLVILQRDLGRNVNAVFEGRDMGTVVFPDADLKIFLTGDAEIRAQRRYDDLLNRFPNLEEKLTLEEVLQGINQRDHYDSTRKTSPLRQAEDAHLVDTSNLTANEVVMQILEIRDRQKK